MSSRRIALELPVHLPFLPFETQEKSDRLPNPFPSASHWRFPSFITDMFVNLSFFVPRLPCYLIFLFPF